MPRSFLSRKRLLFIIVLVPWVFLFLPALDFGPPQVKTETIDGVRHILNPEKPLKGTVVLDVEKALEINPFAIEDVGIRYMLFARAEDGGVILFDPNRAEGHKFDNTGKYLGSLVKKGQGPGEFSRLMGVDFVGNEIWVTDGMKLAKFERQGAFIGELKLKNQSRVFVDNSHFLAVRSARKSPTELVRIYSLIKFGAESLSDEIVADIIQAENVGMIMMDGGYRGFAEPWGTPNLIIAYGKKDKRIYAALNTKYEIMVKDLKGRTLFVIEKKHKNVKVNTKDKEKLLGGSLREFISVYPDELVAFQEMRALPNGYLVVRRVSGVEKLEADVFDPEGRYLYALKVPEGISLERATFHGSGFSLIQYKEDYPVYIDYRIKNLPEVFGK
jgi:hypothetical protein